MATITSEVTLPTGAEQAWALLRAVDTADKAFPGVLTACRLDGDVRTVTFTNGMIVRERIVTIDDTRRRVAYAVIEGRFRHYHASMQVIPDGPDRSRFVWVSDFLPGELELVVRPLVEQGTAAFLRVAGKGR
jgi:polyketide cyclase/dehydrase/lipid transport protein